MSEIKRLVVHCSDSTWGTVEEIDKWHKQRGWRGIGYNLVIYNGFLTSSRYDLEMNGRIVQGRPLDMNTYLDGMETGAHVMGFNDSSIGICLIGKKNFTVRQFDSLHAIIDLWDRIIPGIEVIGHRDLDNRKTCPNFDAKAFAKLSRQASGNIYFDWSDFPIT